MTAGVPRAIMEENGVYTDFLEKVTRIKWFIHFSRNEKLYLKDSCAYGIIPVKLGGCWNLVQNPPI